MKKSQPILPTTLSDTVVDHLAPFGGPAPDPLGNTPGPRPPEVLPLHEEVEGISRFWAEVRAAFGFWGSVTPDQWDLAYREILQQLLSNGPLPTRDYYDLLEMFAARLEDGHTGVLPPAAFYQSRSRPGLRLEPFEDSLVIVESGTIPSGTILTHIDGEPVMDVYHRVAPTVSASTPQDQLIKTADRLMRRSPGTPIQITGIGPDGRSAQWTVTADYAEDIIRPVTAQLVIPDIAYIDLPHFRDSAPVVAFDDTFPHFEGLRGLIIDLRSNTGGSSGWGMQILSRLIDQEVPLWRARIPVTAPVLESWGLPARWWLEPSPGVLPPAPDVPRFSGPVAVLTSSRTYSAAEDFVVAFRSAKRGVVVGQSTGGSTGQPAFFSLPGGGWGFVCGVWELDADNTPFVGKGISPDIVVTPTRQDYIDQRDVVLDKALQWIDEMSNPSPHGMQ